MKQNKPESNGPRPTMRFSAAEAPPAKSATAAAVPVFGKTQAQLPSKADGFAFAYLCERLPSFVQTFVYREVEAMTQLGMKPFVVSIRRPDDPPEMAVTMETPVFYMPEGGEVRTKIDKDRELGRLPFRLHRTLPKHRSTTDAQRMFEAAWIGPILVAAGIRHVHAHFGGIAARTAWWLKKLFGLSYSFTGHANDIFCDNDFPVTNAMLVKDAKFVVTETDYSKRWMEEKHPFARGRIFRVFNGIRMDDLPQASHPGGVPKIVSVGRYVEKKGFPDLIKACAILRDRNINFTCEIIGGGEMEAELESLIFRHNLGDRVFLLGPRSQTEVRERIATARVFALACQRERDGGSDNLPTVIMEAMAIGVPVVSTRVAGGPEMIDDTKTGFLVAEHDIPAFASALATLLTADGLSARFGAAAAAVARERFSAGNSALELARLLVQNSKVDAPVSLAASHADFRLGFWQKLMR